MINSAAGVLQEIAHRLGCAYNDIETVVDAELGGEPLVRFDDPAERLDVIREKLLTPECESVVEQAARLRRLPKSKNGAI